MVLQFPQAIENLDVDGSTPLAVAVANGHRELAKLLIENGAGVDVKIFVNPLFVKS